MVASMTTFGGVFMSLVGFWPSLVAHHARKRPLSASLPEVGSGDRSTVTPGVKTLPKILNVLSMSPFFLPEGPLARLGPSRVYGSRGRLRNALRESH